MHRRWCDIGVTVEPPGELEGGAITRTARGLLNRRVYSHVRVFSSSWSVGRRLCAASAVVVLSTLAAITCAAAHSAVDDAGRVSSYETATRALDSTVKATKRKGYDFGVLADSPVAYWRLGDASGSAVADSSGNGNMGRYTGNVRLAAPALIKGTSRAASFDGNDDRDVLPDSASLQARLRDQPRGLGETERRADGCRFGLAVDLEVEHRPALHPGRRRPEVRLHSLQQRHP